MEASLVEIFTTFGGTSPLIALIAWHMFNMHKAIKGLADADATVTNALHDVDKRLAVIESHVNKE